MESAASTLVLVAHPDDETLGFSSVCAGADVVSVTDGGWRNRARTRADEFRRACDILGAKRALLLNLPDVYRWNLPIDTLVERLKALGPYRRVYTHSPFDEHAHHRGVALAASKCFEEIWVQTCGGYAAEAHVLDPAAFRRKVEILNTIYAREIAPADEDDPLPVTEILFDVAGVETYVPTRYTEVVQAFALSRPEIRTEFPNIWGFEVSPYEVERYDRTCEVLARAYEERPPASILELGACEGAMTLRLRRLFPATRIRAVESHPVFARRLRERLAQEAGIELVEASVLDIPLSADLVVVAEMLYYMPEHTAGILSAIRADALLTSYYGTFDDRVCRCLRGFGWHNAVSVEVLPRFEPVDGRTSYLLGRRAGSHIRLWTQA